MLVCQCVLRSIITYKIHLILPARPDIRNVLPRNHIHSPWHADLCETGWNSSAVLVSLYQRRACACPPRRVKPLCRRHSQHSRSAQTLRECRMAISVSKSTAMLVAIASRRIPKPRPVQLFGEPIPCHDTDRYLGVRTDTQLTSSHVDEARKRSAQNLGALGPLVNRKNAFLS